MLAEDLFLGKDATYWTVAACFFTLILITLGIYEKYFQGHFLGPELGVEDEKLTESSSRVDDFRLHIRVPVFNQVGKIAAENVEIFLEEIHLEHSNYPYKRPTQLPIRFKWTQTDSMVCARIDGGERRLLEFGSIHFRAPTFPALQTGSFGLLQSAKAPTEFAFFAESTTTEKWLLPVGTYKLRLLITSNSGLPIRETFTLTIRAAENRVEKKLSEFIQLIKE